MIPNESFWSLIAFDPRRADAIEQVEEAVTKWGMKFSKEEIDLMLGGNAQQIFKIPDDFRKNPKLTNIDGLKD